MKKQSENDGYQRLLFDTLPLPILVMDDHLVVTDANLAADDYLGAQPQRMLRKRLGDALHCLNHRAPGPECGKTPFCPDCVIRNTVETAHRTWQTRQAKAEMKLETKGRVRDIKLLLIATPFINDGRKLVLLVLQDITEIETLRTLIPVCANCRKVRNDAQYWQSVEEYLANHPNIRLSHGICPDCARALYPELYEPAPPSPQQAKA